MSPDRIIQLYKDGTLTELCRAGYVATNTLQHIEMFLRYDALIKSGHAKTDAAVFVAEEFKVDFRTVQRAVRKLRPAA